MATAAGTRVAAPTPSIPARLRRSTGRFVALSPALVWIVVLVLLPNIFLPYSFAAPSWRPGFKPLKALASYASALGYVWGWYRAERPEKLTL